MAEGDEIPDNAGHRSRVRERLLRGEDDALLDHEVVEYLLALTIARRDTKALAKALLREFGGFGGLLTADADALVKADGLGERSAAALKIVKVAALRLLRQDIEGRPMLGSWQALLDYLRADMAHLGIERVRILHLNAKNALMRDEVMSEGSIDQAPIYAREVIRRALDIGSSSLILVHNHPSGDPSPSPQDIAITKAIADAGRRLDIIVHDHVIIGTHGHVSLRERGLI